ncbi:phosphate ABC transporter substrate-binding protein [Pelobium manganitolerans]|uniref:Phosphate ABC transporter substrate-binding protein n=1 Tax=Pelobium manganitolerans TaxID=1842495 RepID=A0A419SBS7_9SPHI|nr:substrate-binding domain-containing protein [Pelobium manganitolerans]RKD20258.1 phosphate ABC transporter substrate-binding protein [Pelobium manganitolerans]
MNKKSCFTFFSVLSLIASILFSCTQQKSSSSEQITVGESKLLADESLYPIVDDEYQIFAENYKRAQINISYKPEQDIINSLLTDSIDIAILGRELNPKEAQHFEDKKIIVRSTKFAIDGIALVTGKSNQDTLITVEEIKQAFEGKGNQEQVFVFDNAKSSTVSYLMELTNVKVFPKNVYALKTNKEVIRYVNEHPNSIGIVSVAWMKRPTPDIAAEVENLKFMSVKTEKGTFEKPSQTSLKLKTYPLTRDLYLINCQGKAGLGTGFASFLASELGQRIILKSGLAPDSLPSRKINIRH